MRAQLSRPATASSRRRNRRASSNRLAIVLIYFDLRLRGSERGAAGSGIQALQNSADISKAVTSGYPTGRLAPTRLSKEKTLTRRCGGGTRQIRLDEMAEAP